MVSTAPRSILPSTRPDPDAMWLFTSLGTFVVVREPQQPHLTVCARTGAELNALRARYAPQLGATRPGTLPHAPFSATIVHGAWAAALSRMAFDVDYADLAEVVARRQGAERAQALARVRAAWISDRCA